MQITMDHLRLGVKAQVVRLDTTEGLTRRLRDFGFVPGTVVYSRYRTPGGSVTAVELRGTILALRTRELGKILVRC